MQLGEEAGCVVQVYKRHAVDSHMGTKSRSPQAAAAAAAAKYLHQQSVEAWKMNQQEQALQEQQKHHSTLSALEAAVGEAVRQKAIQFAAVLHTLRHQHLMLAYEQQQEFQRFYFDNKLGSAFFFSDGNLTCLTDQKGMPLTSHLTGIELTMPTWHPYFGRLVCGICVHSIVCNYDTKVYPKQL